MRGLTFLQLSLLVRSALVAYAVPCVKRATTFVGVDGAHFTLGGSPFYYTGTNAYCPAQLDSNEDIDKALDEAVSQNISVIRTWGFNDFTSTQNYGAYYQVWSGGNATINEGPHGLDRLEYVIKGASSRGLKLILPLVNNWGDYGGMDVYVDQLASGSHHSVFYTNEKIVAAFKSYTNSVVSRYKDKTAVLAWELANEPRCKGSKSADNGDCTTSTITVCAKETSSYIKSIDSNHLVALGDEGFIGEAENDSYPYTAGKGISFTDNLVVDTLDFGTFHLYTSSWGVTTDVPAWGAKWIADHQTAGKSAGKPVVIEEFGVTDDKYSTYQTWYKAIEENNLAASHIWQLGITLNDGTKTADDGYAIYPEDQVVSLIKADAAVQTPKN